VPGRKQQLPYPGRRRETAERSGNFSRSTSSRR